MIRDALIVIVGATAAGYGIIGFALGTVGVGRFVLGVGLLGLVVGFIFDEELNRP